MLGALQATRNLMRGHRTAGQDMIEFAVPHSLAFAFFPHWLMELRHAMPLAGAMKTRLIAMNVHDAVLRLTEGGCDLLIAYHHPAQPLQLNAERYEMLSTRRGDAARLCQGRPRRRAAVSPAGRRPRRRCRS